MLQKLSVDQTTTLFGAGRLKQANVCRYIEDTPILWCVALLPNGNCISGSRDNSIKVWDRLTGECLFTLSGHTDTVRGVTVCPNGDVVSASTDRSLRVWRAGNSLRDPYVCQ